MFTTAAQLLDLTDSETPFKSRNRQKTGTGSIMTDRGVNRLNTYREAITCSPRRKETYWSLEELGPIWYAEGHPTRKLILKRRSSSQPGLARNN